MPHIVLFDVMGTKEADPRAGSTTGTMISPLASVVASKGRPAVPPPRTTSPLGDMPTGSP